VRDERSVLPSLPGLFPLVGAFPSLERLGYCRGYNAVFTRYRENPLLFRENRLLFAPGGLLREEKRLLSVKYGLLSVKSRLLFVAEQLLF
jgi:hypothetical protein